MKRMIFVLPLILTAVYAFSQTTAEYAQIVGRYEQWKAAQYKSGAYATPGNCKMTIVTKDGYKGPLSGIPKDISIHYADINGDGKLDGLVTFHPVQCDGGNALMNAQTRLLILSKGSTWTTDDKFIDDVEGKRDGWLSVNGANDGTIHGTYYDYAPDDGRCCPSIRKSFTIDYKTKKLSVEN